MNMWQRCHRVVTCHTWCHNYVMCLSHVTHVVMYLSHVTGPGPQVQGTVQALICHDVSCYDEARGCGAVELWSSIFYISTTGDTLRFPIFEPPLCPQVCVSPSSLCNISLNPHCVPRSPSWFNRLWALRFESLQIISLCSHTSLQPLNWFGDLSLVLHSHNQPFIDLFTVQLQHILGVFYSPCTQFWPKSFQFCCLDLFSIHLTSSILSLELVSFTAPEQAQHHPLAHQHSCCFTICHIPTSPAIVDHCRSSSELSPRGQSHRKFLQISFLDSCPSRTPLTLMCHTTSNSSLTCEFCNMLGHSEDRCYQYKKMQLQARLKVLTHHCSSSPPSSNPAVNLSFDQPSQVQSADVNEFAGNSSALFTPSSPQFSHSIHWCADKNMSLT